MHNKPLAYFITFTTYGSWLHGDQRKSVIRQDGAAEMISSNLLLYKHESGKLKNEPVQFDMDQRNIILNTIIDHCLIKKWKLWAVHVRSNHVHLLVETEAKMELVMKEIKSWATRNLRKAGHDIPTVWTAGGSKRYVFTHEKLKEKIHYVIYEQGELMQYYFSEDI